jgi:agmatine/peptidylarginine deiminase
MKHIKLILLVSLLACANTLAFAQEGKKPDWKKLHYLSEEEMLSNNRSSIYQETDPPAGDYVRFPAEFEPMQAVTIRYPLGIPTSLVKQLSERTKVYVIVTSSQQNSARNTLQNAGCTMSNITFYNMSTDSYWVRDYAPWYIFNDLEPAIVDNAYNRNRDNDNMVPVRMGSLLGLTVYGMNLTHTGGNMMEDGRGVGVSDELVIQENNYNETNVRDKMRRYLGIDPYHITIDPQGQYIAHVDCWGKLLAPDKILIAQLPASNSHYADYEEVAEFFANTNCCWGYPYKVYRVYEPGGNTVAPYTNSLIINKTVFVPIGSNSTYNDQALAVYQEALPGYEIIGVTGASSTPWENTDALHCRTRGVMDFDMLFVDHRDVVFGEQPMQDSIAITSKFIAYSGQPLKQDSLLVYYSIDGGAYQTAKMRPTGNTYEYVGYIKGYNYGSSVDYYVYGADQSEHRYTQPVFGAVEPHHFVIEEGDPAITTVVQTVSLASGWTWWTPNVDMDGATLLSQLEQGLGANGIKITAQNGNSVSYMANSGWGGRLNALEVGKMYQVKVSANCNVTLEGPAVDLTNHSITLVNGINWIGFFGTESMSVSTALSNLQATEGDKISSQNGTYATYMSGSWGGRLQTLEPGKAYIYNSKDTISKTFYYPSNSKIINSVLTK